MKVLLLLFMLCCALSCSTKNNRNEYSINKMDSISVLESESIENLIKKNIYHITDTAIDRYTINYYSFDRDEVISQKAYYENDIIDTISFPTRNITLNIKFENELFFQKEFSRNDFSEFFSSDDLKDFTIHRLWFHGINNGKLLFEINLCVPDTDACVDFEIVIDKNGDYDINEIPMIEMNNFPESDSLAVVSSDTNVVDTNIVFEKIRIIPSGEEIVDSVIGNFRLKYRIYENEDRLPSSNPSIGEKVYYFVGSDIELSVDYNEKNVLNRLIKKDTFEDYFLGYGIDIAKYSISSLSILSVEKEVLNLELQICIPDTDLCCYFILKIDSEGIVKVEEIFNDFESD
ncbi:MAG: DUF4738 domain-containing protein [Mediterranea massiliensis]|nr:DUF4738 domain-containing protein [Mediterranea massiliensis]